MKRSISSVPQIYRNLRRWTEIVRILSKYGLADWLSRFQIDFVTDLLKSSDGKAQSTLTHNQRIRLALTELGTTFIKFGQALSTRPDVVGTELADELSNLQANVPADDSDTVISIIEAEQGRTIEELFESFDRSPLASGSIGQVHRAVLRTELLAEREIESPEVVVKVRHPGIEEVIEADLDILQGLAGLAERIEEFRNYQPSAIVREISRTMRFELDFLREQRNLAQFRMMFRKDEGILIPQPITELCTSKILTMQYVDGISLRKFDAAQLQSVKPAELAQRGANAYLKMIFNHGFFHADPHPGNILITPKQRIALIDFGMVGRISERLREDIEAMLVAIVNQDVSLLTTLIRRVGNCPPELSEAGLSIEIADFVGNYSSQNLGQFDLSGALTDFVQMVRRNNITLPSEASMLIKVLVSLEGTGKLLNPEFSLMELMKPFQRMLVLKRMSPSRQVRKLRRFYMEAERLIDTLPQQFSNIMEQIQTGRFDVHLQHRRLGATANRLVMGMMTSALFLGSATMLSSEVKPVIYPGTGPLGIHDISVLGLAGMVVSIMMGLRIVLAIRNSGNLDQND